MHIVIEWFIKRRFTKYIANNNGNLYINKGYYCWKNARSTLKNKCMCEMRKRYTLKFKANKITNHITYIYTHIIFRFLQRSIWMWFKISYDGYKHISDLEFYRRVVYKNASYLVSCQMLSSSSLESTRNSISNAKPRSSEPFSK